MQPLQYQRKFCEARELITDSELRHVTDKYHKRHPTFSIDIEERTCKTIILACIYHYRHIEVNLRCQYVYNDILHKFESTWSTDNVQYKKILEDIFLRRHSLTTNRSLDDQIGSFIEQITKYFVQLKPIEEEEGKQSQPVARIRKESTSSSIELIKYDQSPQTRRRQLLQRSSSWSQSLTTRPTRNIKSNTILIDSKKKT